MSLVRFRLSGGGEPAFVNPDMVVCLMQAGPQRTQVVTAGLATEASITLIVAMPIDEVADCLDAGAAGKTNAKMSKSAA